MNPAEQVESPLGNSVSNTLDGVSEVLSSCDESHAHQQEGHTEPVVKPEHEIVDPGRIMFGDDGLQGLNDPIHVDVMRGAALPSSHQGRMSALLWASSSQTKPVRADAGCGLLAWRPLSVLRTGKLMVPRNRPV